jgi:hypothetical protein
MEGAGFTWSLRHSPLAVQRTELQLKHDQGAESEDGSTAALWSCARLDVVLEDWLKCKPAADPLERSAIGDRVSGPEVSAPIRW